MRLPCSILVAALLCGAFFVSSASAATPEGASFALRPVVYDPALPATKSYFILPVKPGATVKDEVRIVNTGGATGTASIYPVDATTGETSGAVYLSRQAPRRDVGAWITVATPKVTLAPEKDTVVAFTVRVPRSVRPGDHLGAIVAENAQVQNSPGKGALQIRIKHLTIAAVELQLPGTATGRVVATGVEPGGEHGYQYVYIHLKSTGNVLVKPAVTLTVRNEAGRVVAKRSIQLDTFVPGTTIDYPALLPKQALKPGDYTAEVRLQSSTDRVEGYRKADAPPFDVTQTFPFTVTPNDRTKVFSGAAPVEPPEGDASKPSSSKRNYVQIGVVAVLAALLIGVLFLLFVLLRRGRKRRRGQAPSNAPKPAAPPGELASAAPPVEEDEVPGWAGLLAAYDSRPRPKPNGSTGEHAVETPAPAAAAALAVSARQPVPEPEQAIDYLEEPSNAPVQATTWPPPTGPGPTAVPALVVAAHRVLEPVDEPEPVVAAAPTVEQEPASAGEPEDAFELQPEPWFEPQTPVERALENGHAAVAPAPAVLTVRSDVRALAEANNISAALVEASLIALAALLATRLLKDPN